jgi:hypothetical protein
MSNRTKANSWPIELEDEDEFENDFFYFGDASQQDNESKNDEHDVSAEALAKVEDD